MLSIVVSAAEWDENLIHDFSRDQMNGFLIDTISKHVTKLEEIQKTAISFPSSLTKGQRYNIHKLSITNEFDAISHEEDADRFILVTLSKKYVLNIFDGYDFSKNNQVTNHMVLPKTEREILFDSLLAFINTNMQDLFERYLNTI